MRRCKLHMMGASGSGTTTLARALADHWSVPHADADDYFWVPTDPPYWVRGWTAVTVSKVLHRGLPHIVPIIDSRVRQFYEVRSPQAVRRHLWEDITENRGWLDAVASRFPPADGQPVSLLRCADILIWSAT